MRSSPPLRLSCPSQRGFQMVRTSLPGPSEEAKGLSASFLLGVWGEGLASLPWQTGLAARPQWWNPAPTGIPDLGAADLASPGERTQPQGPVYLHAPEKNKLSHLWRHQSTPPG